MNPPMFAGIGLLHSRSARHITRANLTTFADRGNIPLKFNFTHGVSEQWVGPAAGEIPVPGTRHLAFWGVQFEGVFHHDDDEFTEANIPSKVFTLAWTYELEYRFGVDESGPDHNELGEWAQERVVLDAWPYSREYIFSTCGRMGPPFSFAATYVVRTGPSFRSITD